MDDRDGSKHMEAILTPPESRPVKVSLRHHVPSSTDNINKSDSETNSDTSNLSDNSTHSDYFTTTESKYNNSDFDKRPLPSSNPSLHNLGQGPLLSELLFNLGVCLIQHECNNR